MSTLENTIADLVFHRLRTRTKARAASLRREARGYWNTNMGRYHELRARAAEFDKLSAMIDEMQNDLPAYPANEEKPS